MSGYELINVESIQNRIFTIRGFQVMLDRDLSGLYQVQTKRLNEQVKRNIERFPEQFRFQLTHSEKSELVANCDRFENLKHSTLTRTVSKRLELDVKKLNAQYPPVIVKKFETSHDRFLIIDDSVIYHFGASLKDLGKKWFAFSKMEAGSVEMLGKLESLAKVKINE